MKNLQSKNSSGKKGRESTSKNTSKSVDVTPFGAIHNSRPKLLKICLDFIVIKGLGTTFQQYLDDKGINFNLTEYYDD